MKYHQNISIAGIDQPAEYNNRKHSNFFNEGKWQNFIEPLLPSDPSDRTFVEIGCNVGLFLRLAREYGFRDVIGVEADAAACEMAEQYRDAHGLDYKILNRTVGKDFSWDELPAADVVLLSNMHYYIPLVRFLPFLDRMIQKTLTCIVVSRQMRDKKHGHPLPDIDSLCRMFCDWKRVLLIETTREMLDGDPHRRRVHSLLFRSRLQRRPIEDHTRRGQEYLEQKELIDIAQSGNEVELEDTLIWAFWAGRKKGRWTDEQVRAQAQYRLDFTRDMLENGMKEPILIQPNGVGIDGGNRAAVQRLLGYESIIVRIV